MDDFKQARAGDIDVTALISILRASRRSERSSLYEEYDILISFVGPVLLPPYLPRIRAEGLRSSREDILRRVEALSEMYSDLYSDHELTQTEAEELSEVLKSLGARVLSYLSELRRVVHSLAAFQVKNVIFYTDAYEIPWSLSCYGSGTNFKFLSSEYPCGTLLVDDDEDALSRLKDHNVRHRQLLGPESRTKRVCIVCGDLGGSEEHAGLAFDYARRLTEFFRSDQACDFEVDYFGPKDWRAHAGSPKELIGWLNVVFENAEIVHYIGHVKKGSLFFDEGTQIDPERLKQSLDYLEGRPLVVLQACESASFAGSEEGGSHLCKIFLERGASGCLAPVLPINIPTQLDRFGDTLIALFYKNIINKEPYGRALANAQNEYEKKWGGDSQGFFFQLFGDPRAVWSPPPGAPTHLAMARAIAAQQVKGASELVMRVSCEGLGVADTEIASELIEIFHSMPEVRTCRQIPVNRELGLVETAAGMGPYVVFALTGLWTLGGEDFVKSFLSEIGRILAGKLPRKQRGQEGGAGEAEKDSTTAEGVVVGTAGGHGPTGTIKIVTKLGTVSISIGEGGVLQVV
jgi:hypothetical protein